MTKLLHITTQYTGSLPAVEGVDNPGVADDDVQSVIEVVDFDAETVAVD